MEKKDKYSKECPQCKNNIFYLNKSSLLKSKKEKSLCKKCAQQKINKKSIKNHPETWKRNCPNCNTEQKYKHYVSYIKAKNINPICLKCVAKIRCEKTGELERLKQISKTYKGKDNPMYGRTFYEVWVEKFGKEEADEKLVDWKKKIKTSGGSNGMFGRTFYEVWVEKFGKEEADEKYKIWLIRQKETAVRGEANHRFGKPSPQGSGNGWSGWYKDWFFRSLRELSFMVGVIERFGFSWENGEKKKWMVEYKDWDGKVRNYFPDFVLNENIVVECKPKNLWESKTVQLKKEAAEIKFEKIGMKYKLFSPDIMSEEKIKKMYLDGAIKFTKRYEQKFIDRFLNKIIKKI